MKDSLAARLRIVDRGEKLKRLTKSGSQDSYEDRALLLSSIWKGATIHRPLTAGVQGVLSQMEKQLGMSALEKA